MKKLILLFVSICWLHVGLQAADLDTLRVYFDQGQTQVSPFQQSLIDIFLKTHYAQGQMIVAGHADNVGDNVLNLNQSRIRATVVAEYLLEKGIRPDKLLIEAWGETKPIAPNTTPANRTRNRRVELIGIPFYNQDLDVIGLNAKPITLQNGTPIKYKEMTTPEGLAKHIFMVVLRKGDRITIDTTRWQGYGGGIACGGVQRSEVRCPERGAFAHKIKVAENFRCPVDQLHFKEEAVEASKAEGHDKYFIWEPQPLDSAYYFIVPLNGLTDCNSLDHILGKDCYTLHPAKIIFDGLKVNYLKGKSAPRREAQIAKAQGDGSYLLDYTNDDPSNLHLFAQVSKGKHRKMALRDIPLDKLHFDPQRNAYCVTAKDVKRLRKQ